MKKQYTQPEIEIERISINENISNDDGEIEMPELGNSKIII